MAKKKQSRKGRPPPVLDSLPEKAKINARAQAVLAAIEDVTFPMSVATRFGEVSFAAVELKTDSQGQDFIEVYLHGQNENDDPHFRILNPPLLVADPNGDIAHETQSGTEWYREDPFTALAETLALRGGRSKGSKPA